MRAKLGTRSPWIEEVVSHVLFALSKILLLSGGRRFLPFSTAKVWASLGSEAVPNGQKTAEFRHSLAWETADIGHLPVLIGHLCGAGMKSMGSMGLLSPLIISLLE